MEYWEYLQEQAFNFTSVISYGNITTNSSQQEIFHSATGFTLKLGSKNIFITANHVIKRYVEEKNKTENLKIRISNKIIEDIESKIIDSNSKLDICTIELIEEHMTYYAKKAFEPENWPPTFKGKQNDKIIIVGYPSIMRIEHDFEKRLTYAPWILSTVIDSVNASGITTKYNTDDFKQNENMRYNDEPGAIDLKGMSGSPVFLDRTDEYKNIIPCIPIFPIGVVYEVWQATDKEGIFKISNISHIDKNGMINTPYLP